MSTPEQTSDLESQIHQRKEKLAHLREKGTAYPNQFKRKHYASDLHHNHDSLTKEQLAEKPTTVQVAGRVVLKRVMGKASFITIQDMSASIQIYLRRDDLAEGIYQEFKTWDLGDIVGVSGYLFKTKTDELSVHANNIQLLTKCLRPLPDKFHGLADQELRYRQRYVDLIVTPEARNTFQIRSKAIDSIRNFLTKERFLEVETPMMHPIPGGATAKPFETHHNTLDMTLYLRIAPELYLKRLLVGGFERVFEINRSFRNEGISTRHNPEFTMLEFYQAYADYNDSMDLSERMLKEVATSVLGTTEIPYGEHVFDFAKPFERLSLTNAIKKFNAQLSSADLQDSKKLKALLAELKVSVEDAWGLGKLQLEIFEKTVEHKLIQPTFITDYPTEVSPLARQNDARPEVTERFELFIAGREIANGFSELNDPEEQAARFQKQVDAKNAGDEEAMFYDEDYINALEYGMPPAAGQGIGIDRLVMLLTNQQSIKDVLLFPLLRLKAEESKNN